jgi:hypothetical protein
MIDRNNISTSNNLMQYRNHLNQAKYDITNKMQLGENFVRRIPPRSAVDTWGKNRNENVQCFHDKDIVQIHTIVEKEFVTDNLTIFKSENGKWVIQQQALRGCTAAAVAMLIHDRGESINIESLFKTNLGNKASMERLISATNLLAHTQEIQNVKELKAVIDAQGSAIVSISDVNLGGHVVVVDEISKKGVRLRDPYHGWEITVTLEALKKVLPNPSRAITIPDPQIQQLHEAKQAEPQKEMKQRQVKQHPPKYQKQIQQLQEAKQAEPQKEMKQRQVKQHRPKNQKQIRQQQPIGNMSSKPFFINASKIIAKNTDKKLNVQDKIDLFVRTGRVIKRGDSYKLNPRYKSALRKNKDALKVVKTPDGDYILLNGHRRLKASLQVGSREIPVKIVIDCSTLTRDKFSKLVKEKNLL